MKEGGGRENCLDFQETSSFTILGMNIYPDLLILPNDFSIVNSPYFKTVAFRRSFTVLYRYNF